MDLAPAIKETVLEGLVSELLQELREEINRPLTGKDYGTWDERCYAELVGNKDRHWVVHVFDFTEEEMVDACRAVWDNRG